MPETERPKVGRKRSEEARRAILTASLDLLRERGYGKVSVDAIAERAGVGKQTMYRWWRSKGDVVLEALTEEARAAIVDRDTGELEGDLRAFLAATFRALAGPRSLGPVMRGLMAEAQLDTEFGIRFGQYTACHGDSARGRPRRSLRGRRCRGSGRYALWRHVVPTALGPKHWSEARGLPRAARAARRPALERAFDAEPVCAR